MGTNSKQKKRHSNLIRIEDYLFHGKENAITLAELSRRTGIDKRELCNIIQLERREGVPICASKGSPKGYFLANSGAELKEMIDRMTQESKSIAITKNCCIKALEQLRQEGSL